MTNVSALERKRLEPNPDVVKALEELLEAARAGKLQGLVVVNREPENASNWYTFAGDWDPRNALYAIERCRHELMKRMDGE